MKRHQASKIRLSGLIFVLIVLLGLRYYEVNTRFPSPKEKTIEFGEGIDYNGCTYQLTSWEWKDGSVIKELLPNYSLLLQENGEEYPIEKEKVAFASIKVTNVSNQTQEVDFTSVALESGAWHNQWDIEVFNALNEGKGLVFQMEIGESCEIMIPIILFESQFTGNQWKAVEQREFHIVLSSYPEKIYLTYQSENQL